MVMTANMLHRKTISPYPSKQTRKDLQQISHTRNHRIHGRANRIDAQPPRPRPNRGLLNHHNILLDPILAQNHVGVLGQRVVAQALGQRRLAGDDDIAPVEFLVQPPVLLPRLGRQQPTEERAQHDQEDARRRVCARVVGRPRRRVERRGRRCLEHRHHHHRHVRGAVCDRARGGAVRVGAVACV